MNLNIVLHCGGMAFNGDTIKSASLGGSETAAYYVARELAALGHRVTLFTNSQNEGVVDGVTYCFAGQPTEASPLGDRFDYYAQNTPHDVLIAQRHPAAFRKVYAAKLTYWWVHDLALYRMKDVVQHQLWNVTKTLCVSEYHKEQVHSVYGINKDSIEVLPNGVDPALYVPDAIKRNVASNMAVETGESTSTELERLRGLNDGKVHLLYSSRPERGLENLVMPDGIMDKLGDGYVLHVCGYENTTPDMRPFYEALWDRIAEMPNAINHGPLTKLELAELQQKCDAWVYPTKFEEVFCITAAECMMAGLPIVTTDAGCLDETLKDYPSGNQIPLRDGEVNIDAFVGALSTFGKSVNKAPDSRWSVRAAAAKLLNIIEADFAEASANPATLARHLINVSDIAPLLTNVDLARTVSDELDECYGFYVDDNFDEHYRKYYDYEKARGINYGPERLDGNRRFEAVASQVSTLPSGAVVLDYGCAHGHYTINLAKRFPLLNFVGVDLCQTNIDKATAWAGEEEIANAEFRKTSGGISELGGIGHFDMAIAAEVLEHVAQPQQLADDIAALLKPEGIMLITTPYGPWEAIGYKDHWPWRAHIHHFERQDLMDAFGHHSGSNMMVVPSSSGLGSYITMFRKPTEPSKPVDYERKLSQQAPQQTVSACFIVKDGTSTLKQAIESIKDVIDELVVGVDRSTTDMTREMVRNWATQNRVDLVMFDIDSPIDIGFDAARNLTIAEASCDWILWMDSDEVLYHPQNLKKYLRSNQYSGYALKQHHMAVEPLAVIKTDMPCRLFRNNIGIQFFGLVHEHPERKLNEGVGNVTLISDVDIMHTGYATEDIRRKRFERNIGLMAADREKYPTRKIGKFLWLRDLSLMCQYEYEQNGQQVSRVMLGRASEGIRVWEELIDQKDYRFAIDGLEFYSKCVRILGGGFDFAMAVDSSKMNGGLNMDRATTIQGHFKDRDDVDKIIKAVVDNKVDHYSSRYF